MKNPAHLMVNLSWRCNQQPPCSYCWVQQTVDDRDGEADRSWEEWARALTGLESPCTLDFVGGEPLIYPGFYTLLRAIEAVGRHVWAVTSNLLYLPLVMRLSREKITGCRGFTCSWHPHGVMPLEVFAERAMTLRTAGYPVYVNVVAHEGYNHEEDAGRLRGVGLEVYVSPYEHPPDVAQAHDKTFVCEGGLSHAVIDPQGYVYRCLTHFRHPRRERFILGNFFDRDGVAWPAARPICTFWCEQFYVLDREHPAGRDMFGLNVREVAPIASPAAQ